MARSAIGAALGPRFVLADGAGHAAETGAGVGSGNGDGDGAAWALTLLTGEAVAPSDHHIAHHPIACVRIVDGYRVRSRSHLSGIKSAVPDQHRLGIHRRAEVRVQVTV